MKGRCWSMITISTEAYRECGLRFVDIVILISRNLKTANQLVQEDHTKHPAGFHCPSTSNALEDRYIVRSASQDRIAL
ncbi:hypothetical protein TNCV_1847681 [Trichonephila clavipes]|nr:hypothetical protein TNCV_1847681 [Trichonephila clavipes]